MNHFGRSFYVSAHHQHYFVSQKNKTNDVKYNVEEDAFGADMQVGASYNVLYKDENSIFGTGFVPNIGIVWGL